MALTTFSLEATSHERAETALVLASHGIIGGRDRFGKAIGKLPQRAEKEAYLGLERTAGVHRWSFDYTGICPTSMASIQAQECA